MPIPNETAKNRTTIETFSNITNSPFDFGGIKKHPPFIKINRGRMYRGTTSFLLIPHDISLIGYWNESKYPSAVTGTPGAAYIIGAQLA